MAHSKIFLGHNHHGTRAVVSKPTSCKLRHNYPGNFADGLKVKGRMIIPDETTPIDNVVGEKDILRQPVSYGGWREIVQADTNNNISKDLFSLNDFDNMKSSASEIVKSRQQDSSEYKFTNSLKEKHNTSPLDVKRKRLCSSRVYR